MIVRRPKVKDKKKESKTKTNLAQAVSTHTSTSQADGSDSDSLVFSFSNTTIVGFSDNSEWILDTGATYHLCPNRDWFSGFEKLDGCFTVMGDDHPCNVEGIDTVRIKMFNGIVQELKEVRYVPQLKRNLISVGVLKTLDLVVSIRNGVAPCTRDTYPDTCPNFFSTMLLNFHSVCAHEL